MKGFVFQLVGNEKFIAWGNRGYLINSFIRHLVNVPHTCTVLVSGTMRVARCDRRPRDSHKLVSRRQIQCQVIPAFITVRKGVRSLLF